jgi:MFS family permease
MVGRAVDTQSATRNAAALAWLITAIYYFYQYALRSAPAVMVPQLTHGFGLTAAGLAHLVGLFYYGYAIFSLVAGVAMDQLGPQKVVPIGAAAVGLGALLFATGEHDLASAGRLLQGAGGAFALIGAVYIVTTNFPASRAATFIGATQMFGMAGGSAGQFLVGPLIASGLVWSKFWSFMGFAGLLIAGLLFVAIPKRKIARDDGAKPVSERAKQVWTAMWAVFSNPQSLLCGLIAGLFFIPTTIFDMVWGVRFLEEAHNVPFAEAVMRSASVPFGWIIGCPLLGALSDRIGRRRPVIIGAGLVLLLCLSLILFGPPDMFPVFSLGLVTGIASGAAMIPYVVIKETNRPEHSGTATGIINFINFSLSALLGPVFGLLLTTASDGGPRALAHYQAAFAPMVFGVAVAILLALFLRETGPAARAAGVRTVDGTTEPRRKDRPLAAS